MKSLKPAPPLFEERWEHRGYEIIERRFVKRGSDGAFQLLGKHDGFERPVIFSSSTVGACINRINEITMEIDP